MAKKNLPQANQMKNQSGTIRETCENNCERNAVACLSLVKYTDPGHA